MRWQVSISWHVAWTGVQTVAQATRGWLQPSGVRIQDLYILGVKFVPAIYHVTANWGRCTFVFSRSLDWGTFSLAHILWGAILTLNVVHHSKFLRLILWSSQYATDGVNGLDADCNPCSSDFSAEYFRHTLDIRHRDNALVWVLILSLSLGWIFSAIGKIRSPAEQMERNFFMWSASFLCCSSSEHMVLARCFKVLMTSSLCCRGW